MARTIATQWEALGIHVRTRIVSSESLAGALSARQFDAALLSTPPGGIPIDPDFYPLWHSSQAEGDGNNFTSYKSEVADRLLVEARHTLDTDTRRALYYEFQTILARDLPALPLYHPIYNYAVSTHVKDVQIGPLYQPSD
ncbi:MAG: peptide ABC transporter substrate-binding protein, partial [Ardenticatenaceae bacterium]